MERNIKNIYCGLREQLRSVILWVSDHFHLHPLSLEPGGFDVVVEYHSGEVFGYDKIKSLWLYVQAILCKRINLTVADLQRLKVDEQLIVVKNHILII